MTPRIVNQHIEANNMKKRNEIKEANYIGYLNGLYVQEALRATVGNMFNKGTPYQYPKEPFNLGANNNELSDDDIQKQRDEFVAGLMVMKSNFELSKKEEV